LVIASCSRTSPEKSNDHDLDISDSDIEETTDFTEEEETCSNDEDFDSWDYVLDLGQVDHVSKILPYTDGYLLSGVIDYPYNPYEELYLPGYLAFMNKDYTFNWQILIDRFLIAGADHDDDGNIYAGGHIPNTYYMALASIDENGDLLWKKSWSDDSFFYPGPQLISDVKYFDNSLYLSGFSGGWNEDGSITFNQPYLAKTDLEGNILWKKVWRAEGHNYFYDMIIGNDGFIYLTGKTEGNFEGNKNANEMGDCGDERYACGDAIFLKTDIEGNVIWARQWGSDEKIVFEYGQEIALDEEQNIFVLSLVFSSNMASSEVRKYDSAGNLIWSKMFESEQPEAYFYPQRSLVDKDGSFKFAAVEMILESGENTIYIKNLDSNNGEVIDSISIPSENEIEIYGLESLDDKLILMGQYYFEYNQTGYSDTFFKEISRDCFKKPEKTDL
jgi:hypothetical protein